MPSGAPNDDGTNPQIDRLIAARQHLEQAAVTVLREAAEPHKAEHLRHQRTARTLSALESAECERSRNSALAREP